MSPTESGSQTQWRWLGPLAAVLIAIAASIGIALWSEAPEAVAAGPTAEITAPKDGFKLRRGRSVDVRIRVRRGSHGLQGWALHSVAPDTSAKELASSSTAVDDAVVATLYADDLLAGEPYVLALKAEDGAGATATAAVELLVPDPQYALIPLEEGNLSTNVVDGRSVDSSGDLIAMGGDALGEFQLVDAAAGTFRRIPIPLGGSSGQQITRDGRRYFFDGVFRLPDRNRIFGVGYYDLATGDSTPIADSTGFFSVDGAGGRVAFQSVRDLDPSVGNPSHSLQYFLYDDVTKTFRQITREPHRIHFGGCASLIGTRPVISYDGNTVVFATGDTLGLVPPDSAIGCRIFAYDVPTATLRHVVGLPAVLRLDLPVLSDDGGLLTFVLGRPNASDAGAVIDVRTGAYEEGIGGGTSYPTFDAVVSGDGSRIVVSTEADLDARVGNADHNMEIFVYDIASGVFTQVSDTSGGIVPTSGPCPSYQLTTNRDARVIAFGFHLFSVEGCELDGTQRHDADGLAFRRVRAIRKRAGNHGPKLEPLPNVRVESGKTLALEFRASDPDGDHVLLFAQAVGAMDVPPGSEIEDHRDGTASFRWATLVEQFGAYRLRVAAFDEGGGEDFDDFDIAVCRQLTEGSDLHAVLTALFAGDLAVCSDADVNQDGAVTAADVIAAVAAGSS